MATTINYGDTVTIAANAPKHYRPGVMGSACGFRTVASERESMAVAEPVGTPLWLVEFSDGTAMEVPTRYLVRAEKPTEKGTGPAE